MRHIGGRGFARCAAPLYCPSVDLREALAGARPDALLRRGDKPRVAVVGGDSLPLLATGRFGPRRGRTRHGQVRDGQLRRA